MKRLTEIAVALRLDGVRTHLKSGNLLFNAPGMEINEIGALLEAAIEAEYGFRPAVILRTRDEIERVAAVNPYSGDEVNRSRLVTVFLRSLPSRSAIESLDPGRFLDVSFSVIGREMYVLYGDGLGSSKFVPAYYERRLRTVGTARNWNTVTKVLSLLKE